MAQPTKPKAVVVYQDESGKEPFTDWLNGLRDPKGRRAVLNRLGRLEQGLYGDCAPVGEGVSELRLFLGPGYRVYFGADGDTAVILLCGGKRARRTETSKPPRNIGGSTGIMAEKRAYRDFKSVEEEYFRKRPEEIEAYIEEIFDAFAEDNNTAALLASLRVIAKVKGITHLAEEAQMTRQGVQHALSAKGNPRFDNVNAIMKAMGYRLTPKKIELAQAS